ncbi:protein kinase, putative [Eimeria brunetti]|uniref:Protein kinase, putative n=1 Tax=Eimeria brunetti TaxID=51314 RepID=U6L9D3_9EIME|nr:protein kinase, putative [Eimeria brunetti]
MENRSMHYVQAKAPNIAKGCLEDEQRATDPAALVLCGLLGCTDSWAAVEVSLGALLTNLGLFRNTMNDPEDVPPAPPDPNVATQNAGAGGAGSANAHVLRGLSDEKELFLSPAGPQGSATKQQKATDENPPPPQEDGPPPPNLALNAAPPEVERNKFTEHFTLGPVLGKGAYAPVHLAVHKTTGRSVAVKIYAGFRTMEREKKALITREVQIMRRLQHENIVKYGGSFNESQALYIVMQHLGGGSLYALVQKNPKGKLSEACARKLFLDVARGVAYLHSQKPGAKCRMACGTPSYMPPEILKKKEYEGPPADMWSLGVVLYAMLHGCYPFRGQKPEELYANISTGEYVVSQSLSEEVKALLQGLLLLNPDCRLKADQVLASACLTDGTHRVAATTAAATAAATAQAAATTEQRELKLAEESGTSVGPSSSCSNSSKHSAQRDAGGKGLPHKPKGTDGSSRSAVPSSQLPGHKQQPAAGAAAASVADAAAAAASHATQQGTKPAAQRETPQQPQPQQQPQQQQQQQQQAPASQQTLPEPKPHTRFLSKVCEIFASPGTRGQRPVKL